MHQQHLLIYYSHFGDRANVNIIDHNGSSRLVDVADASMNIATTYDGKSASTPQGMYFGTDSTAFDKDDYNIGLNGGSIILEDQFEYLRAFGIQMVSDAAGDTAFVEFAQLTHNFSGSNITIQEVGFKGTISAYAFLWARFLTGGVTLNSGNYLLSKFKVTV